MLAYPDIDPVAFAIGPVKVHWYGLMYVLGFAAGWWLARRRAAEPGSTWKPVDVDDLIFFAAVGVIAGGRLGWILFYGFDNLRADPLAIVRVWEGGMSFHGGLIGVMLAVALFSRRRGRRIADVFDFTAPLPAVGLCAGRIGNFINGELWGRFSSPDLPWGMVFPQSGSMLPRHPSQVYQFLLEGLLLFVILWLYARKERRERRVSAVFLIGYGVMRFTAEFFREPDDFLGLLALNMSMGQWLCVPMVLFGIWLYVRPGAARSGCVAGRTG
jgi:phosphatidylglycerol:prolipoprotein diacylglycerol transferase